MTYGLLKTKFSGDERKFYSTQPVNKTFSYIPDKIINQGEDPICAACASSVFLNWNYNKDFNEREIFKNAGGTSEGISFKEILQYLRKEGLIQEYAIVPSELPLKTAITINGPCLGALLVKDETRSDFWNGTISKGLHGVAIIGWDDKGFIIQNSWGEDWGKRGLTTLPYERFSEFKELWTIIA